MNIIKISFSNLRFRKLNSIFNIIVLSLAIALITTIFHISSQIEKKLNNDLQGIDLVVGAKGSPMQIILSAIFHLDVPTGNISLDEANKISQSSLVKLSIPIALGDNYKGFRIVGTNENYIKHYQGELETGNFSSEEMNVVIGNEVAKTNKLKVGDEIIGSHGIQDYDDLHSNKPYKISGILRKSNNVIDKLIITTVESVWHVHNHDEDHEEDSEKHHDESKEITNLLIIYKTPLAAIYLPREVNKLNNLQSAIPSFEMARLVNIFGIGIESAKAFAIILIVIAIMSFFVTLFNSLNERSYDIALMRSLGAKKITIVKLLLTESLILGFLSAIFGIILSHLSILTIQSYLYQNKHISLNFSLEFWELYIVLVSLIVSLLGSIIPAIMAYKVNVSNTLSKNK
ncbi:MAG: FtsX-like permease family protein [Pelagibacterales bacterium]|nr:FtsX-like permease family protein [Pelagibacterales bacterium]